MTPVLRWLVFGAALEVIAFMVSIPKDSTAPEKGLQLAAAYTQVPGMVTFFAVLRLVGGLPAGLSVPLDILALVLACIIQAGLFGLPFWLLSLWWQGRRST
jgi:hypothetical protein